MKVKRISLQEQKYGYDIGLLFVTVFLCIFGLIMIYSASYYTATVKGLGPAYYLKKQLVFTVIGLILMLVMAAVPYRIFNGPLSLVAYGVGFILIVLTTFTSLGHTAGGRTRWITLFGQTFQTAEIVKVGVIAVLAWLVTRFARQLRGHKLNFLMLLIAAVPALLVFSNDLSSAAIIAVIPVVMIVILNNKKSTYIILAVLAVLFIGLLIYIKNMDLDKLMQLGKWVDEHTPLHEYQMRRLYVWNDPTYDARGDGYQVLQGLYAIGSGGLFGKGLGAGTQKLGFVPEASNDMIFAILCEELGLFGAFALILLYVFMLYRMMRIAVQAEDVYGALFTIGVMTQIAVQAFFHIAVVTNLLPNTGISLPFISYGGTSSIFLMGEVGLVISVGRGLREKKKT
nr:cell division protein FtsW [Lachnospiraceae bacterium]